MKALLVPAPTGVSAYVAFTVITYGLPPVTSRLPQLACRLVTTPGPARGPGSRISDVADQHLVGAEGITPLAHTASARSPCHRRAGAVGDNHPPGGDRDRVRRKIGGEVTGQIWGRGRRVCQRGVDPRRGGLRGIHPEGIACQGIGPRGVLQVARTVARTQVLARAAVGQGAGLDPIGSSRAILHRRQAKRRVALGTAHRERGEQEQAWRFRRHVLHLIDGIRESIEPALGLRPGSRR